jgi:hypothetical protein
VTDPCVDARQRARSELRERELLRLEYHQAIIALLKTKRTRAVVLSRAWREIRRWRRKQLCSADYIQEWEHLLAGPIGLLIAVLSADTADARRLRQNSPFLLCQTYF